MMAPTTQFAWCFYLVFIWDVIGWWSHTPPRTPSPNLCWGAVRPSQPPSTLTPMGVGGNWPRPPASPAHGPVAGMSWIRGPSAWQAGRRNWPMELRCVSASPAAEPQATHRPRRTSSLLAVWTTSMLSLLCNTTLGGGCHGTIQQRLWPHKVKQKSKLSELVSPS